MKVSRLLLDALETFPNFVIIDKNANVVYLNESYAVLLGIQREPPSASLSSLSFPAPACILS